MKKKSKNTLQANDSPQKAAAPSVPAVSSEAPVRLKLLVTVINREKAEFYADYLQSNFKINFQTILAAEGTADSETLRLLGLADTSKNVIFSVVREDQSHAALIGLEEKFGSIKNGKGVACTIPLTGTIGVAIYRFLGNIQS